MDAPVIPIVMEVGDDVVASLIEEEEVAATTGFTVTNLSTNKVYGANAIFGPSLDKNGSWVFEVTHKADLHLPDTLSAIAAVFQPDPVRPVKLLGSGDSWQLDGGGYISISDMLAWEPWENWDARVAQYENWKLQAANAEREGADVPPDPEPILT